MPMPPPARLLLLHARAGMPAENSTCTWSLQARDTHKHRALPHHPGSPAKPHVPFPGDTRVPMQHSHGHGSPSGPVPPWGCFLQCRKPHCSCSPWCFRPPSLAQGSAARHTCEGPQHRLCPTGHGTGCEHPSVRTDLHVRAHSCGDCCTLTTHTCADTQLHAHMPPWATIASQPPSHLQRHHTRCCTSTHSPLTLARTCVCTQVGTSTCSHLPILMHAAVHVGIPVHPLMSCNPPRYTPFATRVPKPPAHLGRCCPGA